MLSMLVFAVVDAPWNLLSNSLVSQEVETMAVSIYSNSTPTLGNLLFREFIIPLEAAGLVLVSALLGAIALVSRGSK